MLPRKRTAHSITPELRGAASNVAVPAMRRAATEEAEHESRDLSPAANPAETATGAGGGGGWFGDGSGSSIGNDTAASDRSKSGVLSAAEKEEGRVALENLLAGERQMLKEAKGKAQKQAETVTDEMMLEVQELLDLFGVPYVLAPSEAEAQCAELERLKLVDGIVTDDADVFLFGGRRVLKNIFSEQRFVEMYEMASIEEDYHLSRESLILLALLLGSDYTEGVAGVGPVNACEIVQAFPTFEDMTEFRNWCFSAEGYDFAARCADPLACAHREAFARKHKNVVRRWEVSSEFPSRAVVEAYMKPAVDRSEEAFEWGEPQVERIVRWARERLSWDERYTADVLKPVMASYHTKVVQLRMESFSATFRRAARIKSKRVQRAVQALKGGAADDEMMLDPEEYVAPKAKAAGRAAGRHGGKKPARPAGVEGGAGTGGDAAARAGAAGGPRAGRAPAEEDAPRAKRARVAARGRGRGRGRRGGRGPRAEALLDDSESSEGEADADGGSGCEPAELAADVGPASGSTGARPPERPASEASGEEEAELAAALALSLAGGGPGAGGAGGAGAGCVGAPRGASADGGGGWKEGSADEDAASGDERDAEALAAALAFSRAQARAAEHPPPEA
jgi:5'-3' exonuclease